jgi:hypothetical protein
MTESPFLEDGRQWAWNSSTLEPAKTCARKYQYIREGYTPKGENIHLTFGGIYAAARETFHKLRAEGVGYNDAQRATVDFALKESFGKLEMGEDLAGAVRYKSRPNLIRSIVWYLEEFRDDPCTTIILDSGKPAVELTFKFQVSDEVWLTGHLDRVVDFQGDHYIQDQKTTGSALGAFYFKRYTPNTQMSLYTMASQVVWHSPVKGVMIDAAQIAQGFTRFARGFAFRTKEQTEEWLRDSLDTIQRIWQYTLEGYYPQNDAACQLYGGCPFLEVCSKSPQVRQQYLDNNYEKRFRNPLENL